jgi:hypothetical protein
MLAMTTVVALNVGCVSMAYFTLRYVYGCADV